MHKQRIAILAAAGLGIFGLLLPWAKVESVSFFGISSPSISYSGFAAGGYGWLAFLGIAAAAGILFKNPDRNLPIDNFTKKVVLIGGGVTAVIAFLALLIYRGPGAYSSELNGLVSVGIGSFLTFLGGLAIVAVPFVVKDDGEFEVPTKDSITEEFKDIKDS